MISGQRDTRNVNQSGLVIDMDNIIHMTAPDETPFATMALSNGLGKLNKELAKPGRFNGISLQRGTCDSPKHEWLEDEYASRTTAINYSTGYSTTATSIVVDDGTIVVAGQVLFIPQTKEVMHVTAVSTNTLTVVRNKNATVAGHVLTDNDEVVVLGSAHLEGSVTPTANSTDKSPKYNYTQIFKRTAAVTRTTMGTKHYGGDELPYQAKKMGAELMRDLEWSLFLSQRSELTTGDAPVRTMGSFQSFVITNVTAVDGVLTESAWISGLRGIFTHGKGTKIAFCSPLALDAIAGWATGKLQTFRKDDTLGINITRYVTPHGDIHIVNQPVFTGLSTGIGGYIDVLDMEKIQLLHLSNGKPVMRTNVQANNVDGREDVVISETTMKLMNELHHGRFTGITG